MEVALQYKLLVHCLHCYTVDTVLLFTLFKLFTLLPLITLYTLFTPVHTNQRLPIHNELLAKQVYLWAFCSPSGFEPMTFALCTAQESMICMQWWNLRTMKMYSLAFDNIAFPLIIFPFLHDNLFPLSFQAGSSWLALWRLWCPRKATQELPPLVPR